MIRDWVLLRLHHRSATGIITTGPSKLAPQFYGSFQVIDRLGAMAYRLQLLEKAHIHHIFHAALLKKFEGTPSTMPMALPPIVHGRVVPTPLKVVRARLNRGS